MQARFRIRTAQGQELEPRTLEIFSEMVRSGVVRSEDLVFDALTAEWVEAGRHPMVRLFQDPLADLAPPDAGGLGFALAAHSGPTHQEREAEAIRRLEEERRSDPERAPLALEMALVTGRSATLAPQAEESRGGEAGARRHAAPGPDLVVMAPSRGGRRRAPRAVRTVLALTATASLGLLAGVVVLGAPESPAATPAPAPDAAPMDASGRPPEAENAVRSAAEAGFLRRAADLRDAGGLAQAPAAWLEGEYLAGAAEHPDVPRYWTAVRRFADALEGGEAEMYREAWLEAAEEAGLSGAVRSLRLATALEDFAAGGPARSAHYRRVRELAASALDLHELLVHLGDRVTFEPMRGGGLSADPVLEAAGADPEAQALLEEALDRVLAALRTPGGDSLRDRGRLAAWMADVPL